MALTTPDECECSLQAQAGYFEDLMSFESAGNNRGRCGSLITAVGGVKTTK
jgi:hypothetical protein